MPDDLESLVALNMTGMVGGALHRRLVERFGSARNALTAPVAELRQVQGVGEITARRINEVGRYRDALKEIELAVKEGILVLPIESPDYPAPLKAIHDPPLVLYVKGTYAPTDAIAVGVVGSRKCTPYGERQGARFGADLAEMGVTVISGLARGVDTKAHIGAMRSKEGRTIAVLGSGLMKIYPPENEKLLKQIVTRGSAISEFPLRSAPEPGNFPRRNRIISGLSLGILVVEAAEKSGALITADWALEQNREIFCVPGAVESPMSRGVHRLIQQGAKLVEEAADIVNELPALESLRKKAKPSRALSSLERAVAGALGKEPATTEAIAAETRLPLTSVQATLLQLVAKSMAEETGSGVFRTVTEED